MWVWGWRMTFVARRGRCRHHGWCELTNCTAILWALIAFTFTFYLYLHLWMMLHIVINESWSMEDGQTQMLQLMIMSALFCFKKTSKRKKPIQKLLEREIEKYDLLVLLCVRLSILVWTPQTMRKRDAQHRRLTWDSSSPSYPSSTSH